MQWLACILTSFHAYSNSAHSFATFCVRLPYTYVPLGSLAGRAGLPAEPFGPAGMLFRTWTLHCELHGCKTVNRQRHVVHIHIYVRTCTYAYACNLTCIQILICGTTGKAATAIYSQGGWQVQKRCVSALHNDHHRQFWEQNVHDTCHISEHVHICIPCAYNNVYIWLSLTILYNIILLGIRVAHKTCHVCYAC